MPPEDEPEEDEPEDDEPEEDEPDDDGLDDEVAVGGGELEVELVTPPEFDPQAVAASAARTSKSAVQRRGGCLVIACILFSSVT